MLQQEKWLQEYMQWFFGCLSVYPFMYTALKADRRRRVLTAEGMGSASQATNAIPQSSGSFFYSL
jgi:hypothetical protein